MKTRILTYREDEYNTISYNVYDIDLDPDYKNAIHPDMIGVPIEEGEYYDEICEQISNDDNPSIAHGLISADYFIDTLSKAGRESFIIPNDFDCSDAAYVVAYVIKQLMILFQCEFYFSAD